MDYELLVTSAHRAQPKFLATVALLCGAAGQAEQMARALPGLFDIDVAVGVQLDAVGLWVGVSRTQFIPIADVFFTWDDADLGWDFGHWKGPREPSEGVVVLDDESYRILIKARVASNYWEGDNATAQDFLNIKVGDALYYFLNDNLDMTVTAHIVGPAPALLQSLVARTAVGLKPAGVRLTGTTITASPLFTLDSDPGSPLFAGLDAGVFT